jgi:hypothetical protein
MPHPVHVAAAHRDGKLHRVRRLTLAITGWAAAATLGLGAVFAHALPGHARSTGPATNSGSTATVGGTASSTRTNARSASAKNSTHHKSKPLAAPTQAPAPAAPTPAAPVVSSGGS